MLRLSIRSFVMLNFIFNLFCNVSRCGIKHLEDAKVEVLPARPELVRETLLYKRLRRFVKLALMFRKFELVLEYYEYLPESFGRCIWNILRDESKYILIEDGYKVYLSKWNRDSLIDLASIEAKVILDDDYCV